MKRNKVLMALFAILIIASMLLAGCNQATEAPAETTETVAETEAPVEGAAVPVGIVLPTKDEPRWLQDEARFQEKLNELGYEVEILFSQGDSAKEKTNVENLISKGIKVLIICPQDGTAAAAAAEAARAAGVKVVSYDRLILEHRCSRLLCDLRQHRRGRSPGSVPGRQGLRHRPVSRCTCMLALLLTTMPSCSSKAPGMFCSPRSPMAPS